MIGQKRLARIKSVAAGRQQGVIVLQDIHDPHNAAAVFRTADAFGVQKIYLIFEQGRRFNPRRVGKATSASANKWLDFEVFYSTKKCFDQLKRQGYNIVATVLDAKAKSIFKIKFTSPKIALCFGNEHAGLSPLAIVLSDVHIYIPMRGFVQSLNLSVTAAICLYEMSRQRNFSKKFLLSKPEQNKLITSWKRK
jgi:tRNA (guanosine-2'-O-)-methyltransferase